MKYRLRCVIFIAAAAPTTIQEEIEESPNCSVTTENSIFSTPDPELGKKFIKEFSRNHKVALKEIFGKNNLILKIAKSELLQSIWEETNRWNRLKWKSSLRHIIKKLKSRLPQVEDAADYIDKLSIGLSDSALSKCKTYVSQQLNKGEKGTISDALGAARPHLELVLVLCLLLKCLDKRSISVKRSSEAKSAILMELIYELAQIESLPNARRLKTSSIKRSMR